MEIQKTWSDYQKAIFKNIAKESGHLIVEAFAGAAKSTTLVESIKYVPKGKKVLTLAFNKIIQEELRNKIGNRMNVETFTFHALGFRAIKQNFGGVELNDNKCFETIQGIIGKDKDQFDLANNLNQTVKFCKACLVDTPKAISEIIARFDIDICDLEEDKFIGIVIKTLGETKKQKFAIDYNDMVWFPFIHNMNVGKYDYVYVDEYQDLNKAQLIMAKSALKPDGRLIIVGDMYQGIYSWNGADNTVVESLRQDNRTKKLPLPISYRCPKKIIDLAKNWTKDITCPETAKEGSIEKITYDQIFSKVTPGCFILSRLNAPLIKLCMKLIKVGKKANIRGRDVGNNLDYMIRRSKKKTTKDFIKWLDTWKIAEIYRLKSKGIPIDSVLDKVECLITLCEDCTTLKEVQLKIKELFNDDDKTNIIWLSSVHKCKGLESDSVFILDWTLRHNLNIPLFGEADPSNEEANIAYIAATRSKNKLFYVSKAV